MDLHTAGHRVGVVCAPHALAVETGRAVLAEGGNALEAMVAMAADIAVVYPHMNQLGGDAFWLVREPSGRMRVLMAAGAAGSLARPELYREAGHDVIPSRGPLAALTVPGAIAGWLLALEAAKARGGRMSVASLLEPAQRHAAEGYPMSRSHAVTTGAVAAELKAVPGFAETFLMEGKAPAQGAVFKQPALAATLEQLMHAGLDDFYRGDIGRELAADLDRVGAPVTRADLQACRATLAEPLSVELAAGRVWNTPPPTPGLAALMMLALFERLRVKEAESFDHVHGLIEAAKRALNVRDAVITDPARLREPVERYLTDAFLDAQARTIDRRKASDWNSAPGAGDTIWMGAADASGLVVSYIQSIYWEYGSGVVLPKTGVLMQNRGVGFSLRPGSLNQLAPGRVPPHTLCAAMAALPDGRLIAYGSMGGDAQPQVQATVFTRHVLYGVPLDRALDRPRWRIGRAWGSAHANVVVEPRLDDSLIEQLIAAGHDVTPLAEPYADMMGHAGAVVVHPDGTMEAAHDPRADGGAAGI